MLPRSQELLFVARSASRSLTQDEIRGHPSLTKREECSEDKDLIGLVGEISHYVGTRDPPLE